MISSDYFINNEAMKEAVVEAAKDHWQIRIHIKTLKGRQEKGLLVMYHAGGLFVLKSSCLSLFGQFLLDQIETQIVQITELVHFADFGSLDQFQFGAGVHDHQLRFGFSRTREDEA